MRAVQDNAAHCVRNAIAGLRTGSFRYEMDNGGAIAVRIDIDRGARRARVDFTGTSAAGRPQLQRAARGVHWPPCCTCSAL